MQVLDAMTGPQFRRRLRLCGWLHKEVLRVVGLLRFTVGILIERCRAPVVTNAPWHGRDRGETLSVAKIEPAQQGIVRDAVAWNANASRECLLRVGA